jgi:tRNA pseudouridine32 synthase/23S rRNA pseudouridine746 synthase
MTPEHRRLAQALLIHEDAHVLAFNKPAGLASQGGRGQSISLEDLLEAFAKSNGKRPKLIHRLDRDTTGVIIAGRTHPAVAFLSKAFAERAAQKTYVAMVCGGAPDPPSGVIERSLRKTVQRGVAIVRVCAPDAPGAQTALTAYRALSHSAEAALIEARPQTGRMHQIRVHLAAIGRPIAGDGKYGGLLQIGQHVAPGLMLHAASLVVPHPVGGRLTLRAPLSVAFAGFAEACRLDLTQGCD